MGRKSVKEDKSVYQLSREALDMNRTEAGLKLSMSPERLEKLESGKTPIQPEDVLAMSRVYHRPEMCTDYCRQECAIGRQFSREVKIKELSQITIETLNSMNRLHHAQERMLEIVEDGKITPDEYEDFRKIQATLDKIARSVDSLQLWIRRETDSGSLPEGLFEEKHSNE